MVTHTDLLRDMWAVRAQLVLRYEWFIHVTAEKNLQNVLLNGLNPHSDAAAPAEVVTELGQQAENILCLHPLGAKIHPAGLSEPPLVSFAVRAEDLPAKVGLDWSYMWPMVLGRMDLYTTIPELIPNVAHSLGSIVSYDKVEPSVIRVFCKGNRPSDPLTWKPAAGLNITDVLAHQ
jgi:hypothetical protein